MRAADSKIYLWEMERWVWGLGSHPNPMSITCEASADASALLARASSFVYRVTLGKTHSLLLQCQQAEERQILSLSSSSMPSPLPSFPMLARLLHLHR